jgi:hypothetical protein
MNSQRFFAWIETVTTNVKLPAINSLQFCGSSRLVWDGRDTFPVSIDEDGQGQSFQGNLELCVIWQAYERTANRVKGVNDASVATEQSIRFDRTQNFGYDQTHNHFILVVENS